MSNTVVVTGSGSLLNSTGPITVGDTGSGVLTIGSGATVTAPWIQIANSNNATGILNIGSIGGSDTSVTLNATNIFFGTNGGTAILNFNQADTATIASVISGNGSLNQFGNGTTILTGYNTYNGATIVSAGILQYGDGTTNQFVTSTTNGPVTNAPGYVSQLGGNGTITLNGGTIAFAQYNTLTNNSVISGNGSLAQLGVNYTLGGTNYSVGTTILTANNNYIGGTLVSGGALQVGTNGITGSIGNGTVTLTNSASLIYDRADNTALVNAFVGTGNLTFIGAGTTTLSGSSAYNGFTTIDGTAVVVTGSINGNGLGRFVVGSTKNGSSLTFTSGGTNSANSLQVGGSSNSSGNNMIVDNATVNLAATIGVGASASSGNSLTVQNGGNVSGGNLYVGLGSSNGPIASVNNTLTITGP